MYYFFRTYSAEELARQDRETVDVKFVGTAAVHECGTGETVRAWSTGPFTIIETFRKDEDAGDVDDIITSAACHLDGIDPALLSSEDGRDDLESFGRIMSNPAVIEQIELSHRPLWKSFEYQPATVRPDRDLFQDWGDIDLGDSGDDFYG